jgi:serine/threonine-protein kinase
MPATIEVETGPQKGRIFNFERADRFLVGRSADAHLRLPEDDLFVSRNHLLIEVSPPNCYLIDLDSTNGTYLNKERVRQASLKDGDEIRLGHTILRVRLPAGVGMGAKQPANAGGDRNRRGPNAGRRPAKIRPPVVARLASPPKQISRCRECGLPLTELANKDGKAAELADVLTYLCSECAEKWQRKVEIREVGGYRLLETLGRGGMGVVYKAWSPLTCRLVALKTLLATNGSGSSHQLFQREMSVMQELRHANIVRLLDQGIHEGKLYFVSELLEGGDLNLLMTNAYRSSVSTWLAWSIIHDALKGLQHAHEMGFVHRDIKPQNILLTRLPKPGETKAPTAKLSDFGLAKSFVEAGASCLTRKGEVAGTLLFMAPEQILNYRFVKPPADIYSMGVSLYYLLTGQFPFDLPSPLERVKMGLRGKKPRNEMVIILEDEPIPVRERNSRIDPSLASIVDKAILKREQERTQSAEEMKRALAGVLCSIGKETK